MAKMWFTVWVGQGVVMNVGLEDQLWVSGGVCVCVRQKSVKISLRGPMYESKKYSR